MLVPLGLMDRRARLALLESTNLSQDQRNVVSVKEGNIPPELQLFQNQHVSSAPLIRSHQRGVLPTPPAYVKLAHQDRSEGCVLCACKASTRHRLDQVHATAAGSVPIQPQLAPRPMAHALHALPIQMRLREAPR